MRATESAAPPAANGTIRRIGWDGIVVGKGRAARRQRQHNRKANFRVRIISSP